MKRLIILILFTFIVSCAATQEMPTEPGVGYSWWKDAPTWMSKDCIAEGFGLMDGVTWVEEQRAYYLIKIDNPSNGLGSCDDLVLMVEDGVRFRHGAEYPTIVVIDIFVCDAWEELKLGIMNEVRKSGI
jgi:hypothetical protein